jgi:hypothetical protein
VVKVYFMCRQGVIPSLLGSMMGSIGIVAHKVVAEKRAKIVMNLKAMLSSFRSQSVDMRKINGMIDVCAILEKRSVRLLVYRVQNIRILSKRYSLALHFQHHVSSENRIASPCPPKKRSAFKRLGQ